jgi:hypothetical protein
VNIPADIRRQVRERASFACEYWGVTEIDAGGELTVDHIQPQVRGGTDDLDNLLYSCFRCNQFKADYWPDTPDARNPRLEALEAHLLLLADGTLYPITRVGEFTLRRLRLNRPARVAHRLRRRSEGEEEQLLTRYRDLLSLLERLYEQQATLLSEHHALLEEQRTLLRLLVERWR